METSTGVSRLAGVVAGVWVLLLGAKVSALGDCRDPSCTDCMRVTCPTGESTPAEFEPVNGGCNYCFDGWPPGACFCTGRFWYRDCYGGYTHGPGRNSSGEWVCMYSCWTRTSTQICPANVEKPDCPPCEARAKGQGASGAIPRDPRQAGEPVSLTTGNVFFTQTDAVVGEVVISRTYHSGRLTSGRYGSMGPGWNASFEMRVRALDADTREVRLDDGFAQYYFDEDRDGRIEAVLPSTKNSWLEAVEGGGYRRVFRTGGSQTYDAAGRMQADADASGVETSYTYDSMGRLSSIARLGRSVSLAYSDDSNRPSQVLGPGDAVLATYSYDGSGRLATVRYEDGGGYRYGYDSTGLVLWVTDLSGKPIERHEYSGGKAVTSELGDGRGKLVFSYPNGETKTVVVDALGVVTEYEYANVRGINRVTKAKGPCASCGGGASGSGERTWAYDDRGNIVRYQNELGDVWTATYDENDDLLSETNPLNQTTSYTYFPDGQVERERGPGGAETSYTWSAAGPLSITQKLTATESRTTGMTYTPQGRVENVTDPRSKVTHMTYTEHGELWKVTDPLTHTTEFGYDDFGRRTSVQDALKHTTTTRYDPRGRVVSVIQHDGSHTDFTYDERGNRTSVTDPEGRVTRYEYNIYSWLERVIDPAGGATRYDYDVMGHLISLTDAKGNATRFVYDQGRLVRTIYPGDGEPSESYGYDPVGRLSTKTDRKGVVTTFRSDALGRLVEKTYSDGTPAVHYGYDENGFAGRLTSAANGTDTLRWTYDLAGQLLSEESVKNASVVSYGYDSGGNRLSLSLDGQLYLSYRYDDGSRLTTITRGTLVPCPSGSSFCFGYDDANRRVSMSYPNGVTTKYDYDDLNRLTLLQATKSSNVITSFGYKYDAAGNRLTKALPEHTESYGYDALYRLASVDRTGTSSGIWRYGYDAVGNRTTAQAGSAVEHSAYNEKNQLLASAGGGTMLWRGTLSEPGNVTFTSALVNGQPARMLSGNTFEATLEMLTGTNTVRVQATDTSGNLTTRDYQVDVPAAGTNYTYDSNGNLTAKTEGTDNWAYSWNAENQLTKVEKNGAEVARFGYDPLGRRVEKVAGGVTTSYTYDLDDVVREARGQTTRRLVQGPDIDEPLAIDDGSGANYLHADALGSICAVTSPAGAVTLVRAYDAWGNLLEGAEEPGYAFSGREWDPDVVAYYYRARYFDPAIGRFTSEDSVRFGGGVNFYAYAYGDPINLIDPTGHGGSRKKPNGGAGKTIKRIAKTVGGAVGAYSLYTFGRECKRQLQRCDADVVNFCNTTIPEAMTPHPITGALFDANAGARTTCITEQSACCFKKSFYMAGQAGWNELPLVGNLPPPHVLDPPPCPAPAPGQAGHP